MAAGGDAAMLIELGAILIALAAAGRLSDRIGLSPIPLYLVAGLVLGQVGDGPLSFSDEVVQIGAEIGLVLLLFMLGVEYSGKDLSASLRDSRRAGLLDAMLNFWPGVLAAILLGWGLTAALLLGGVTYISSSGIVAKVVADLHRIANRETPAVFSILVIEDLAMAVYLPLVAVLLTGTAVLSGLLLAVLAIATAAAALTVAIRFGDPLSRAISSRSDEVLLLTILGFVLLVAGTAEGLQLSAAVGAFLAGIALSGPAAARARSLISPLRDLFAAAFFVLFGLELDAAAIPPVALVALALAVVTAGTKLVTGWRAAGELGVGGRGRIRAGTALIARGEFSIVIAGLGVSAGIEPQLGPVAAAYVLFSALLGSVATRWADAIADRLPIARRLGGYPGGAVGAPAPPRSEHVP